MHRSCALHSAASLRYLPGLAVLLSSFAQRGGLNCSVTLFWHESVNDTVLNEHDLGFLRCAASRARRVELRRADDARMALYAAYAAAQRASRSALLKLELLLGEASANTALSLWMDADFLVLRTLRNVHDSLFQAAAGRAAWMLHGSGLTSTAPLNTGFFALCGVPPPEVRTAINETLAMRRRLPASSCRVLRAGEARQCGDQALLRYALRRTGATAGHIRVHTDWRCNYRPETSEELAAWHAVHWSGAPKPWGSTGPFRSDQRVPEAMDAAWREQWRAVRERCEGTRHLAGSFVTSQRMGVRVRGLKPFSAVRPARSRGR